MFDGNHTTNQNGDWGMVDGVVLTTVHWKGMDRLERRCFPAFGTCWISAACHPPWTAVSSSAATQRIGAVPVAAGMLRQKLDVMRKEVEIAWPLQKQGIISKSKGLQCGAPQL